MSARPENSRYMTIAGTAARDAMQSRVINSMLQHEGSFDVLQPLSQHNAGDV